MQSLGVRNMQSLSVSNAQTQTLLTPFFWGDCSRESYSNNDPVPTWNDFGSGGNDATQGTAGARPTFKTTGGPNNMPYLFLDGGDYFRVPFGFATNPFTLFVVGSWSAGSFPAFLAEYVSTDPGYLSLGLLDDLGTAKVAIHNVGVDSEFGDLALGPGDFALVEFASSGISGGNITVTPYKNGTAGSNLSLTLLENAGSSTSLIGATTDGTTDFLTGNLSEMILYTSLLTTEERQTVEAYVMNKYDF